MQQVDSGASKESEAASKRGLNSIFYPQSVAVVGVTPTAGTVPYDIFYNILAIEQYKNSTVRRASNIEDLKMFIKIFGVLLITVRSGMASGRTERKTATCIGSLQIYFP